MLIDARIRNIPKELIEHTVEPAEPITAKLKRLFASDLLAIRSDNLSLQHEEDEKQLLQIGEHFGLRGKAIDDENANALKTKSEKTISGTVKNIASMTLTVVDGNFPREVLANQNLTFAEFSMPARLNNPLKYDATRFGPGQKKSGVLIQTGMLDHVPDHQLAATETNSRMSAVFAFMFGLIALAGLLFWQTGKSATNSRL